MGNPYPSPPLIFCFQSLCSLIKVALIPAVHTLADKILEIAGNISPTTKMTQQVLDTLNVRISLNSKVRWSTKLPGGTAGGEGTWYYREGANRDHGGGEKWD